VDFYTDAQRKSELKTLTAETERDFSDGGLALGDVGLVSKVTVFKKIKLGTHENVGAGRVHLPEMEMHTTSCWWELPAAVESQLADAGLDLGDALKGVAHLLGRVAPLFVMADPADLHATAMVRSPFTGKPTLYLYDSFPGGVGYARRIFEQFEDICLAAGRHLAQCPCEKGCPSCVGPATEAGTTAREAAAWLLGRSGQAAGTA
jgi:DEAD/DEAH box helicase domain-containing protein